MLANIYFLRLLVRKTLDDKKKKRKKHVPLKGCWRYSHRILHVTKTKRGITKEGRGNILPPLVAMHKFGRNIGLYELTFIDRALRGHNFHHFIAYGKSWEYLDAQCRKSKERPRERGNELRRRAVPGGGGGQQRGGNANRVKNVYNVSRGDNVAYGISSCEIFSRISWRHATQGTPSLFAARMSLY